MSHPYQPPNQLYWKGRQSVKPEYWHQAVHLVDLENPDFLNANMAFIGYQCEEGVKRNQGRLGTKAGPNAIREILGKLPIHREDVSLADCGDLIFEEKTDLHDFQLNFASHITSLLHKNMFPIGLGGGHDISYAHFCGIWEALHEEVKRFGIVNFDAHFDLRKGGQPSSGTTFYQILKQFGDHAQYVVLGIQGSANTKELFEIAKDTNSQYLTLEACSIFDFQESTEMIDQLSEKVDYLYITVDMDVFSSAYSPGVSAPSPFGLTPEYVQYMLKYLLKTKKVVALDFAETNPTYDNDHATARLAAKLIWEIVHNV